jgi:hypothetical protein
MFQTWGKGYVEALRAAHSNVPETVDYVMYWWDHAARLLQDTPEGRRWRGTALGASGL